MGNNLDALAKAYCNSGKGLGNCVVMSVSPLFPGVIIEHGHGGDTTLCTFEVTVEIQCGEEPESGLDIWLTAIRNTFAGLTVVVAAIAFPEIVVLIEERLAKIMQSDSQKATDLARVLAPMAGVR